MKIAVSAMVTAVGLAVFLTLGFLQARIAQLSEAELDSTNAGLTQRLQNIVSAVDRGPAVSSADRDSTAEAGTVSGNDGVAFTLMQKSDGLFVELTAGWCKQKEFPLVRNVSLMTLRHADHLDRQEVTDALLMMGVASRSNRELLARMVEVCVLNKEADVQANRGKLCNGTSAPSGDKCSIVRAQILEDGQDSSGKVINDIQPLLNAFRSTRWAGLLTGLIQYITIALSVSTLLALFLHRFPQKYAHPSDYLKVSEEMVESRKDEEKQPSGDTNKWFSRISPGCRAVYRTMQNEMAALWGASQVGHAPGSDVVARVTAVQRVQDSFAYADFNENAELEPYRALTELMVKLAFIGTIWGIALSLFSAPDRLVSDVILRVQAEFDMYAGLGTAFGTTLVGVLCSVAVGRYIDREAGTAKQRIRTAIGEAQEALHSYAQHPVKVLPVPGRSMPASGSGYGLFVLLVVAVVLALVLIAIWK